MSHGQRGTRGTSAVLSRFRGKERGQEAEGSGEIISTIANRSMAPPGSERVIGGAYGSPRRCRHGLSAWPAVGLGDYSGGSSGNTLSTLSW